VYALRNVIYRTGVGNNNYSGMPFKFNSGYAQSGPMYLFHNTADAALPGNDGFEIRSPGSWQSIVARNNIWAGTNYALNNANPTQPLDLDYDDLYTTQPGELAWWDGLPDRHLNTLAELRTATGQELHGFSVLPGFANALIGDYTLAASSALIDTGVYLPGINTDYIGAAPDIGANEYGVPAPAAVTDLHVTHAVAASNILTATLRWTAPAGALTTTLRYSSILITTANWNSAALLSSNLSGTANIYTATVPYNSGTIYFALKTQNSAGWSPLSNNAFWPQQPVYLPVILK